MTTADVLPHINATLNAAACALLFAARISIAGQRVAAHRQFMLGALAISALFLVSYATYHLTAPIFQFRGSGMVRPFYYTLLVSHVILAALALPAILATAVLGLRRFDARHRRWARWVWPLWVYVSLSGVIVYLMLHHIYT
ncbi:MAG: DUF420 domain-containing protein [Wenzhouxiangella sp.]